MSQTAVARADAALKTARNCPFGRPVLLFARPYRAYIGLVTFGSCQQEQSPPAAERATAAGRPVSAPVAGQATAAAGGRLRPRAPRSDALGRALARAVSARAAEGDGLGNEEELEGLRAPAATTPKTAVRQLQRLTITQVTPTSQLSNGPCGQREVKWNFVLTSRPPSPATSSSTSRDPRTSWRARGRLQGR